MKGAILNSRAVIFSLLVGLSLGAAIHAAVTRSKGTNYSPDARNWEEAPAKLRWERESFFDKRWQLKRAVKDCKPLRAAFTLSIENVWTYSDLTDIEQQIRDNIPASCE